jgi:hypothetical protein
MTKRLPASPAAGPLEDYAARFHDLFNSLTQRQAFRRYLWRGCCCRPSATRLLPLLQKLNRRRVKILLEDDRTRSLTPQEPCSHRREQ